MSDEESHQSSGRQPARLSLEWDFENLARKVRVQWAGNHLNFVDVPDPGAIHEDNHWDGHTDSHLDANGGGHGDQHFDDYTDQHFDQDFREKGLDIVELQRLVVIVRGLERRIADLEKAVATRAKPGGER
jgi:hypothetical protein